MKSVTKSSLRKMGQEFAKIDFDYFCEEYVQCWFCPMSKVCSFANKVADEYAKRKRKEKQED